MSAELAAHRYGKSRVRLLRLHRTAERSDIHDWTIEVMLESDFVATYVHGDNSGVLTTDTMKNTVYALARDSAASSLEEFAHEVAAFLMRGNATLSAAEVRISSALWKRLEVDGTPDPFSFMHGSAEQQTVDVRHARDQPARTIAGLGNMVVLKTTQSGFAGFLRDALTTLPDTDDRLMGTAVTATWEYVQQPVTYLETRTRLREAMLKTFAHHASKSVQHTLFAMAEAALDAVPEINSIELTMPNRHYLLADLTRLGRDNPNVIFIPTEEPHGTIQARVRRGNNA